MQLLKHKWLCASLATLILLPTAFATAPA
ncbi:MAG: hypothetical protein ACJA0K_001091, partial [Maricaulis maris]